MRLTRIELRNFRCFESLDLDLDQTTVLVGANDTGKSAVLEAIDMLLNQDQRFGVDWAQVRRRTDERAQGDASIIGYIGDLSEVEKEAFGAAAPQGYVRFGKESSRNNSSMFLVLRADEVDAFFDALNAEPWQLHSPFQGGGDVQQVLMDYGVAYYKGDQFWVTTRLSELGVGAAPEALGGLGFDVSAVALGNSRDSSWSPQAVLGPLLQQHLADPADPLTSSGVFPGPPVIAGLGDLAMRLELFFQRVSSAHSRRLDGSSVFRAIDWTSRLPTQYLMDLLLANLTGRAPSHRRRQQARES